MKTFRFNRSLAVLTVLMGLVWAAPAEDVASIFTNHAPHRIAPPNRTSIIFIQCHGLGFGDLSCYGQTNFQTPNLDKLAAEGIRFNHYTPGDTNLAAVQLALMTGKTTTPAGLTVAQVLKNAGYRTLLFGEWNLGEQPWTQGFDQFGGFLKDAEGRNYFPEYFWRYDPHAIFNATNMTVSAFIGKEAIHPNTGGKKNTYLPDYLLDTIVKNCIRNNQPDKYNVFRPFFLLLNVPAPRSATLNKDDFPVPSDAPYSDEPWPQAAKNRAAILSRIDGNIGGLFEKLNKAGMTNNVMIIFSSSAAPERFADKKLDFFHAPADVQSLATDNWTAPMIIWWPGHIPAGQVSDLQWSPVDLLPTLADIGFARAPKDIEGKSILPALLGKPVLAQP